MIDDSGIKGEVLADVYVGRNKLPYRRTLCERI